MTMIDGIHRPNLQRLSTFLFYGTTPEGIEFDMGHFTRGDEWDPVCKTAGCAVGLAPFAGIEKHEDEGFADYSRRTLIDVDKYDMTNLNAWSWCFGSGWVSSDNTREGAARRIQYFLDNGVPVGFDCDDSVYSDFVHLYADTVVKRETDCPLNCSAGNCWFCKGTDKAFKRRFNEIREGREVMECL